MPKKSAKSTKAKSTKAKSTKAASAEKELKAAVATLRKSLAKAEAKAETWKGRAQDHQKSAGEAQARVAKLEKKLRKAGRAAEPVPAAALDLTAIPAPDATWTVTRLRTEARSRGVVGYSRRTKAQLLADLT